MLVNRRQSKHMQNYEYLNWTRIVYGFKKRTRVGKSDEVIEYSAPMFSSFSQWFALGFQHFPRDLANVNEWKIMLDPSID